MHNQNQIGLNLFIVCTFKLKLLFEPGISGVRVEKYEYICIYTDSVPFESVWQLLCSLQWESIQPVLCAWECKHLGETATNRSSLCWWKAIVRICHSYPATLSISLVSWLQTSKSQSSLGSGTVRQKKGQVGYHAQTNKATTNALVVALFAMSSWILVAVQWPKPTMIHPTGPLKFTSLIHSWSQMEILEGRKGFQIFTLRFAIHKTAGSIFGNQRSNFWDCRRTVTKECTHHARAEYDRYTCWLFT